LGGVKRQVKSGRRIVKRAGDRKAGVWVTEIGWASDGPPNNPYVKGLDGQARMLTRSLSLLERRRRTYRVRGVFWYAWRDKAGGSAICDWCGSAGLRKRDGSAKPSWDAFVRVTR
jgi:exo-beta-1,3-glucanase (GH17 family)